MRTLLNIIAAMVFLAIIYNITNLNWGWTIVLLIWWVVGVYSAFSHLSWSNDNTPNRKKNKDWIFYSWYSLNGLVLYFTTKSIEVCEMRQL